MPKLSFLSSLLTKPRASGLGATPRFSEMMTLRRQLPVVHATPVDAATAASSSPAGLFDAPRYNTSLHKPGKLIRDTLRRFDDAGEAYNRVTDHAARSPMALGLYSRGARSLEGRRNLFVPEYAPLFPAAAPHVMINTGRSPLGSPYYRRVKRHELTHAYQDLLTPQTASQKLRRRLEQLENERLSGARTRFLNQTRGFIDELGAFTNESKGLAGTLRGLLNLWRISPRYANKIPDHLPLMQRVVGHMSDPFRLYRQLPVLALGGAGLAAKTLTGRSDDRQVSAQVP